MKAIILLIINPIQRTTLRRGFCSILLLLTCLALVQIAHAVVPSPDGGYDGFNTAEGTDALFSNTIGQRNTGLGFQALYYNNGNYNTAEGFRALFSNTSGTQNTASGAEALLMNTSGLNNTANGWRALRNNTTGSENTATGASALQNNSTGIQNSAFGKDALLFNNEGNFNTAVGFEALYRNLTGESNTAIGFGALVGNNSGGQNTANGVQSLSTNITGSNNTATGYHSLFSNEIGSWNTAIGVDALFSNINGFYNTAYGVDALFSNTKGMRNTAIGVGALQGNITGNFNTAIGDRALNENDGFFNTAIGAGALQSHTTGGNNIAIGAGALSSRGTGSFNIAVGNMAGIAIKDGSNNIHIGNVGFFNVGGDESATIRIGRSDSQSRAFIAGIYGVNVSGGTAVYINSGGQLGTVGSARRFKKEIKPMDRTSESILALKPVTFQYKSDNTETPQFGLIAEEVADVNPDLVVRDEKGEIYSVRYEAVNAMLLNEFLKEHRKVEKQEATIAQLKQDFQSKLAEQQKQIEALTAGLQKVSAQLETSKAMPNVVFNNP
jgi:trimeric autotransporter adhesin